MKEHTVKRWPQSTKVTHTLHAGEAASLASLNALAEKYGAPATARVLEERVDHGPNLYSYGIRIVWTTGLRTAGS